MAAVSLLNRIPFDYSLIFSPDSSRVSGPSPRMQRYEAKRPSNEGTTKARILGSLDVKDKGT